MKLGIILAFLKRNSVAATFDGILHEWPTSRANRWLASIGLYKLARRAAHSVNYIRMLRSWSAAGFLTGLDNHDYAEPVETGIQIID
jgi:hypothetical protein